MKCFQFLFCAKIIKNFWYHKFGCSHLLNNEPNLLVFFLFCWMFVVCNFIFQLVMTSLQSILENVDTPELLCKCVKCILLVARCYPHIFSTNFRVSPPIPSFQMIDWEIWLHIWRPWNSENKASATLSIISDVSWSMIEWCSNNVFIENTICIFWH